MHDDDLLPFIDEEGRTYAKTRGEAFYRDQVAFLFSEYTSARLPVDDGRRLDEYKGWIEKYFDKLGSVLTKLPLPDQHKAFESLFLLTSAYFGVGSVAPDPRMTIKHLQNLQAAHARDEAAKNQAAKNERLKSAIRLAADLHGGAMAASREYADLIRPEIIAKLPKADKVNGWPGNTTIKNMISTIKKEKKRPNLL